MLALALCGYFVVFRSLPLTFLPYLRSSSDSHQLVHKDFVEYWSAYQLAASGMNPYEPAQMEIVQRSLGRTGPPLMMWNPPWLLFVMSPVLSFDFQTSARYWFALNLFFITLAALLLWQSVHPPPQALFFFILGVLFFPPLWNGLFLGQVSLFLLCVVSLLFYAGILRRYRLMAFLLPLLTIKPHLFYLMFVVAAWWIIKEKKWHLILYSSLAFLCLLSLSEWRFPGSSEFYITSVVLGSRQGVCTPLVSWVGANIPGAIRVYLGDYLGQSADISAFSAPGLISILMVCALVTRILKLTATTILLFLLPLSISTSSFGWFFDHSLLLLSQLYCVALLYDGRSKNLLPLSLLFCGQALTFYSVSLAQFQHQLFWFPLLLMLSYYIIEKSRHRSTPRRKLDPQ